MAGSPGVLSMCRRCIGRGYEFVRPAPLGETPTLEVDHYVPALPIDATLQPRRVVLLNAGAARAPRMCGVLHRAARPLHLRTWPTRATVLGNPTRAISVSQAEEIDEEERHHPQPHLYRVAGSDLNQTLPPPQPNTTIARSTRSQLACAKPNRRRHNADQFERFGDMIPINANSCIHNGVSGESVVGHLGLGHRLRWCLSGRVQPSERVLMAHTHTHGFGHDKPREFLHREGSGVNCGLIHTTRASLECLKRMLLPNGGSRR